MNLYDNSTEDIVNAILELDHDQNLIITTSHGDYYEFVNSLGVITVYDEDSHVDSMVNQNQEELTIMIESLKKW